MSPVDYDAILTKLRTEIHETALKEEKLKEGELESRLTEEAVQKTWSQVENISYDTIAFSAIN